MPPAPFTEMHRDHTWGQSKGQWCCYMNCFRAPWNFSEGREGEVGLLLSNQSYPPPHRTWAVPGSCLCFNPRGRASEHCRAKSHQLAQLELGQLCDWDTTLPIQSCLSADWWDGAGGSPQSHFLPSATSWEWAEGCNIGQPGGRGGRAGTMGYWGS